MKRLAVSSILMAIGFLLVVVVYGNIKSLFSEANNQAEVNYVTNQLFFGALGESLKAFLTSWLYQYHSTNKSVITNALKFGVICSAMVASVWLFVGMEFMSPGNKLSFIIDDGMILLLQGLVSGIVLWFIFKNEEVPVDRNA
ncbi:MAG: hypothetical protein AAGA77_18825 [Bacteroidota bacterium]